MITVKGGNLEQKLNGIEVFMRMSVSEKQADGSTRQISKDLFTTRLATSAVIRPNEAQRYTITLDVPPLQLLYADSQDFLQFVLNDQPEFQWKAEGPLPFTGFSFPDVTIGCSADIPGAIDPSTSQVLIIVPEAAGELTPVRVDAVDEIEAIANAYSCQCINQGDQWLVWWSAGDSRVVGWGKLKAIVSMRGEELVRTHTNPHVPRLSVLPRQAGETADTMPGGAEEALALAHQLSRDAGMTAMTRPIGNAFFAVEDLRVVAQA